MTTVSEEFIHTLSYTPETVNIDDLILKGPNGNSLLYKGCIEATLKLSFFVTKK